MGGDLPMTGKRDQLRFFIVEDIALIALDISRRIEGLGHIVVGTAEYADAALQGILETLPDCVLIDIMLKGEVNGIWVAEEINRVSPRPFAYVTAYSEQGIMEDAKRTKPIAYLVKPIRDNDLRRVIGLLLSE